MGINIGTLLGTLEIQDKYTSTLSSAVERFERVGREAQAVSRFLGEASSAFSGAKIFAEAERAIQAIEKIGGVSKLTAAEQDGVRETVEAAIAKYRVLGQSVPPDVQRVADALATVQREQEAVVNAAKALVEAEKRAGSAAAEAAAAQKKAADEAAAAMQRMTAALSGEQIYQDAQRAVKAVEHIGGAAKLTSVEQESLRSTLDAAIAKYRVMGASVPGDLQKVSDELAELHREQEQVASAAKVAAEASARAAKVAAEAAAAQERLVDAYSGRQILDEAARVVKAVESIGGAAKLTANEQRQVNAVVAEAIAKYRALGQAAPPELEKIAAETQEVEQRTERMGKAVATLATPFAVAGGASVLFARDLNASMANVSTLIPENRQRIDEFKGSIQSLAIEVGKGTEDLSNGLYEVIGSIGDTSDSLEILQINAKAGAAGMASTADAINFTSAVTKTYGDTSAEAFQKVSDLGFQAVNIGKTSFPQLAAAIGGVAPLAKETGVSLEELFAVVATATGVTGNTNEVVTQMSSAITALVSPSKELKELYGQLGVASGEALIKQEGLVGALQKVAQGAKDADTPLIDLLGRKEAWIIASSLAGSQAEKFSANLKAMGDVAGETQRAFEKQTQGVNRAGFEYQQARQIFIVGMQQTGDAILNNLPGPLKVAAVAFGETGGRALSMAGEISQVALAARLLAGANGLSGLLGPLGRVVGLTRDLETASKGAAAATTALGASSSVAASGGVLALARTLGIFSASLLGIYAIKEMARDSFALRAALDGVTHPLGRSIGLWSDLSNEMEGATIKAKRQADAQAALASLQKEGLKPLASHGEELIKSGQAATGAARAQVTFAAELANTRSTLAGLSDVQRDEIAAGLKMGRSTEEIVVQFNKLWKDVKLTAGAVELYKDSVSGATRATKDHNAELKKTAEFQQAVKDSVWDTTQVFRKHYDQMVQDATKGAEKSAAAIVRNLEIQKEAEEEAAALQRQLTMSSLALELDAIVRRGEARKRDIDATKDNAQAAFDAVDKLTRDSLQATLGANEEFRRAMKAIASQLAVLFGPYVAALHALEPPVERATEKTAKWSLGLRDLSAGFADLAQSGGPLSGFAKMAGEIMAAADIAIQGFEKIQKGVDILKEKTKGSLGEALTGIATGIVSGVGALTSSTDPSRSTLSRILGGAATGAALGYGIAATVNSFVTGSIIGGPWAMAAGAVVGIFVGILRGRAARREMEIVGKEWGQDISKGLYEKIKGLAKDMGFGRVEASLFSMKDLINEAGGINDLNFDRFLGKLRDVFSAFEGGAFTAQQALHVLGENFSVFAQHVVESGRLASVEFQEILALNARMGLYAQEILDFVGQRTAAVGEGLAAMAGPLLAEVEAFNKRMEDNSLSALERYEAYAAFTAKSAEEFETLGVIAVAAFGAARKAGLSFYDALQAVGPGLDALIKAQQELGLTAQNTALQDLAHFRDRVNQNQTLVRAAEALNDTMLALSQIGGLNADSLGAMEQQGLRTFERLTQAGFTENEALALMADYLNTVAEAHLQLGIPIDENTGRLIEQADQLGLLTKDGASMTETLKNGFDSVVGAINAMIETLGGVPYKVQSIADAINKIPKKIPIEFDLPQAPKMPHADDLPQYRFGSGGLRNFGAGTVVELHGNEAVVTEDDYRALMATPRGVSDAAGQGWMRRLDDLGGGAQVHVTIDARGALVGDYASQQRFKQMVEEALVGRVGDVRQLGIGRAA